MLRRALLDAVTPENIQAIVRQMIHKACEGDVAAARLVLAYAVGKPDRAVDPDTVEVHEFQLWQQSAIANQDLSGVLGRMQAGLANKICRAAVPPVQETTADNLGQALRESIPEDGPSAAAAPETTTDLPAAANSSRPLTGAETTSRMQGQAESSPQRKESKVRRETAKADRPMSSLCEPAPEAGDGEGEALLEEMYREYEREIQLGVLQEVARCLMDQQRPGRPAEQPSPSANGFCRTGHSREGNS